MLLYLLQHGHAATSSQTSVGGGGSAGSGVPSAGRGSGSGGTGSGGGSSQPSGNKFRHGLLQLMIHTIDPLHDGKCFYKLLSKHILVRGLTCCVIRPITSVFPTSTAQKLCQGVISEVNEEADRAVIC